MLVLSRRNLESLYFKIPPSDKEQIVKVQVVGCGKLVRLGIDADKRVVILRQELLDRAPEIEAEAAK